MCCPKEQRTSVKKFTSVYNNVCMMQSSLGVLVVIAMLKEGFNFVGTVHWADEKRMGARRKCSPLLPYRFAKGEREKMVA